MGFDCKGAVISDTSQRGMVEIVAAALWALLKLSFVILVGILLVPLRYNRIVFKQMFLFKPDST